MAAKPQTMDAYLSGLPADKRQALQKLRKVIHAAVPEAEEGINYGMQAFLVNGKAVAGILASKDHCSLFPMSGRVVAKLAKELQGFDTSKGTIRFTPKKPLPAALVKKVVKARLAEITEREGAKKTPAKKSSATSAVSSGQFDAAVMVFLAELKHPLKSVIEAVRQIILGVSPKISEGIKWNSPSFRTTEWFATLNLRDNRVWLILHLGAKVKDNSTKGMQIADPTGMLKWLAKDRCLVTFENERDVEAKRKGLEAVVREWIRWV